MASEVIVISSVKEFEKTVTKVISFSRISNKKLQLAFTVTLVENTPLLKYQQYY